ncbi:MAG: hypothetical protein IJ817_02345 [Clostridia bacterium]|nr:hypothetical protein [Clostridia bacterium]
MAERLPMAVLNYGTIGLDFLMKPKCPKCHQPMTPAVKVRGRELQAIIDTVTGNIPKWVCMNYIQPKTLQKLMNPFIPKKIPCPNHYNRAYSGQILKPIVPRAPRDPYEKRYISLSGVEKVNWFD